MKADDFVYIEVYRACLNSNVSGGMASNYASVALNKFKKNNFSGKVSKLIRDTVIQAKKASKR